MKQFISAVCAVFAAVCVLTLFNGCNGEPSSYDAEAQWFSQVYDDTLTFQSIQKADSKNAYMYFYSSKLDREVTFLRKVTESSLFSTTYGYYSNYDQLVYADAQKTYLMSLVSPFFTDGYSMDYSSSGSFMISVLGNENPVEDFSDFKSCRFSRYNYYETNWTTIDSETMSIFIKTPEDSDMMETYIKNIVLAFRDASVYRNVYVYFASDVQAAKSNPCSETADRKYRIYTEDLIYNITYTKEF